MSKLITNRIFLCSIVALSFLGVAANECLAGGSDCTANGTFNVCVEWSQGDDPVETVDYRVTFNDPAAPDLELLKGDPGWIVYCEDANDAGVPADIGDFTTPGGDAHYTVTIKNGTAAGFNNVGSMSLVPAGGKFSSIAAGSVIDGDISGALKVVRVPLNSGGIVDGIMIGGNITGPVDVPTFKGVNTFGGTVTNNITIGVIDGAGTPEGRLTITGAISGDIAVTGKLDGGDLNLSADVPATSTITIEALDEGDMKFSGDFAGSLILTNGIPALSDIAIIGTLSGSIDLTGDDLGGQINLFSASAGATVNGGNIVGIAIFYPSQGSSANSFDGTATFTSVAAGAEIESINDAHIGGTIRVTGNVAGEVAIAAGGTLKSGGLIDIDGNLTGEVHLSSDCVGDINIDGDATGDITIDGNQSGSITVGGALANGGVGGGRIMIIGETSGAIKVGKKTASLTLIHLAGGLATGATIEINTTEGKFNAEGAIYVGAGAACVLSPPDITFDGCIRIYKDLASGHYGDLDGAISISGCHAPPEPGEPNDLNICVDGDDNGNVNICQNDCPNQVGWSCSGCP